MQKHKWPLMTLLTIEDLMNKNVRIECQGAATASLDQLLPFQGKLKTLTDESYSKFKRIIEDLGFSEPISIWKQDKDHNILNGHQRLETLKRMQAEGWIVPPIPINLVQVKSIQEAKRKVLALTSQYGDITKDGLHEFMMEADLNFDDLSDFKFEADFTMDEFRADFDMPSFGDESSSSGLTDEDEVPEVAKNIHNVKLGQVWHLGRHKLMCGDSTDGDAVLKLCPEKNISLFLTDPPYNVAYVGGTKDKLTIMNDSMDDSDFRKFLQKVYLSADSVMQKGAVFYIWHADSEGYNFRGAAFDIGWKVRQCLIWKKSSLVLGRQDYHWIHEPCLYGWKDGAAHYWGSDRSQTTVVEFDKPSRNDIHPTMKPVSLIEYQIKNSSKSSDYVLDLFLGSGTTLMASEKTGRTCYGMELDPHYCSVIIERWQNFTGKQAELLEG